MYTSSRHFPIEKRLPTVIVHFILSNYPLIHQFLVYLRFHLPVLWRLICGRTHLNLVGLHALGAFLYLRIIFSYSGAPKIYKNDGKLCRITQNVTSTVNIFVYNGLFSLVMRSRNNLLLENSIVFEECALRSIFCRVSTRARHIRSISCRRPVE